MSGFGLTSGSSAENDRTRRPSLDFRATNENIDIAQDIRSPTPSRLRSEIFSDAFRGLKKAIPSREDSLRFTRNSSRLGSKSTGPPSFPIPAPAESAPPPTTEKQGQHVRNLSLQDSLGKPLPVPPPGPISPLDPNITAKQPHIPYGTLSTIADQREIGDPNRDQANIESRTSTMDSSSLLPQQGQLHISGMEVSLLSTSHSPIVNVDI